MGFDVVKRAEGRLSMADVPRAWRALDLATRIEKLSVRLEKQTYSKWMQLAIDAAVVAAAFWASYLTRFDGTLPDPYFSQFLVLLPFVIALYLVLNLVSGLYNLVWRFIG